ncbi:TPA: DNA polymerase [Campylobacter jejuni]
MQIINNLHYITRKEITGLEPSKCDCLLVLQFDFKISSDLYRDNYFNQLLALIVEHDLEIDLLITHSDDTTDLSAHQMCVATLPEYKKVIVSGSTPLKLLFNYEFIQPYTSFMRQGLEIGAKDFLYYPYDTKCYLIDSHRECFYKSQIAKYVAQIENAIGKVLDSESLSRLESSNILPIYDMLTILPELEGKMLGFDYETNGLSGTPDLRLTGIGLSTDTDGYFFYFSEDREEYQLEFELIKPVFIDFLNRNYKNMIVYNSKFESIVTERLFDGNLYEFQDALPLCLAMQSPGTLKKNASAYLGVPLWNEETTDIISKYESVNKLLKQSDRDEMKVLGKDNYKTLPALSTVCDVTQTTKPIVILQTGEEVLYKLGTNARIKKTLPISIPLELNPDNRDKIVEMFIPEFLKENVKKEVTYKITSISSPEEMEILEVVKKKKKKKKDEADSLDTENEDKPKVLGYQITLELEVNQVKELSQLESIYGEKLFKYLSEGYTGWEVCDRHTLGKYCILDAFYSLQLYNRFYPKLKKSYHIYRGQMFISGLMEKYGFSVDKDLYYYFLDYYTKHGTEIFKSLLTTSSVLDNIIEKEYEAECLKVSIDALEDILKDKFPEMKPTKRMRTSIVENSMLEENDYNQLKRGYLEIMPVLQENPESFKLALPQLLRELRTQALDIAKARVSRNVIAQAVKGEIDMAKDLHELKPLCNLNSNTEEHSSRVWGAIMDSTFESVFPLFKLAEKVDYYFTLMKLNPGRVKNEGELRELLNRIKETSGYSKLYSTADMYEQVTTKRFDSAELSIFSDMQFVYKSAITRAKFLKENGRNNTDINEMLGVYKMFFLPDGKTMDDVDDYTDNIKVLYKYLQMKKIFKAITTYIDGSSGSGSMSVVDYSNYSRIRDFSVEGDRDKDIDLLLNTDFYANYKDTLRWGSGMHTLPKLMECTGMLSVRDKDNVLIGFDAAQSEVRVIATIANDTGMLESLRRGEDIHRANAARLFKCKPEEVTKLQRDAAKSAITWTTSL